MKNFDHITSMTNRYGKNVGKKFGQVVRNAMVNIFDKNYWNLRELETISGTHFRWRNGQLFEYEQNFESSYLLFLINLVFFTSWKQDVYWTCIRHSEDLLHIFWLPYVCLIYVLCPRRTVNLEQIFLTRSASLLAMHKLWKSFQKISPSLCSSFYPCYF